MQTSSKHILPQVLWNTNFLKLWAAQFTSQVGFYALYFVLILEVYQISGSNTAVSLLILTFTIPSIIFGYISGVYVDQLSLKKVMVGTNLARTIIIFLLILGLHQISLVFLLVFLLSSVTQFFVPAEGSAIPALVAERELIAANSLFSFTLQTGVAIGFLVGGLSLRAFGEVPTVGAIAFLFFLSLILNFFLPQEIRSVDFQHKKTLFQRSLEGVAFVLSNKKVRDSIVFLTLTSTIIFVLAAIGPGYVDKVLGQNIKYSAALIILPATVGMAAGSFFLGGFGEDLDSRHLINIGLIGLGITFFALSMLGKLQGENLPKILAVLLIFSAGVENALITIPVTTEFQKFTPEALRGRAYGLMGAFVSGVTAIPVLISGALADLYGVRTVLILLGSSVLVFGLYRVRIWRLLK